MSSMQMRFQTAIFWVLSKLNRLFSVKKTSLVVDPSEEKIKTEFEGVKRTYVPMHSVLRIDEVDEQGVSKVSKAEGGNVTQMPNTVFVPDDKSKS